MIRETINNILPKISTNLWGENPKIPTNLVNNISRQTLAAHLSPQP